MIQEPSQMESPVDDRSLGHKASVLVRITITIRTYANLNTTFFQLQWLRTWTVDDEGFFQWRQARS